MSPRRRPRSGRPRCRCRGPQRGSVRAIDRPILACAGPAATNSRNSSRLVRAASSSDGAPAHASAVDDVVDERQVALLHDPAAAAGPLPASPRRWSTMNVVSSRYRVIGSTHRSRSSARSRTHPRDDVLAGRPEGVVLPGPSGLLDHLTEVVSPELRPERLGHVPAPSALAREMIDLVHELLREQQVRAHVHAHTMAHGDAHVKRFRRGASCRSRRSGCPRGRPGSRSRRPGAACPSGSRSRRGP